jgi:hypothetical protein
LVKKSVDQIPVQVCRYEGFPVHENLVEAWEDQVHAGGEVDRDKLLEEVLELVDPDVPRHLADTYA